MSRELKHRAAFDSQGETYVHTLSQKNDEIGREAKAYLAEKQLDRDTAAAQQRDAREKETLQLAHEANAIAARSAASAEKSMQIAVIAAAISALSLGLAIAAFLLR